MIYSVLLIGTRKNSNFDTDAFSKSRDIGGNLLRSCDLFEVFAGTLTMLIEKLETKTTVEFGNREDNERLVKTSSYESETE